jgi:hypothetical protein
MKLSLITSALCLASTASAWYFDYGNNQYDGRDERSCQKASLTRDRWFRFNAEPQGGRPACCLKLYEEEHCKKTKKKECGVTGDVRFGQDFKSWNVVCE